jgi:hypothetical protein
MQRDRRDHSLIRLAATALAFAMLLVAGQLAHAGQKISGTLAPVPADCSTGMGFCKNGLFQSFACDVDNSVCSGGTTAKSKLSLSDKLILKVTVKNLADNDGNPVTTFPMNQQDDHILKLGVIRCIVDNGVPSNCATTTDVYVKLEFTNGVAKATADLSQVFAADAVGTAITLTSASVRSGSNDPFNCPGTNSAADIAARANDSDCDASMPYAVYGVAKRL